MSFDQDPGEQAQISGADFALMCNEMKRLKAANADLAAALEKVLSWIDNWSPEFIYDPDWSEDGIAAYAALANNKESATGESI